HDSSTLASFLFFFTATPTPQTYPLSLHDALPISEASPAESRKAKSQWSGFEPAARGQSPHRRRAVAAELLHRLVHAFGHQLEHQDRKSTRLNSSHLVISYAVFCLKKKKKTTKRQK